MRVGCRFFKFRMRRAAVFCGVFGPMLSGFLRSMVDDAGMTGARDLSELSILNLGVYPPLQIGMKPHIALRSVVLLGLFFMHTYVHTSICMYIFGGGESVALSKSRLPYLDPCTLPLQTKNL